MLDNEEKEMVLLIIIMFLLTSILSLIVYNSISIPQNDLVYGEVIASKYVDGTYSINSYKY